MGKKKDTKNFWDKPFRSISLIIVFVIGVIRELLVDRVTGWGNPIIDMWIANHQGQVTAWILDNPVNLFRLTSIA